MENKEKNKKERIRREMYQMGKKQTKGKNERKKVIRPCFNPTNI